MEYHIRPDDIEMELRIYQNNEIVFSNPTGEDISLIMKKIISFDKIIDKIREQEE